MFNYLGSKFVIFFWLGYLMDELNVLEFEDDEDELIVDIDEFEFVLVSNFDFEDDEFFSDEISFGDLL